MVGGFQRFSRPAGRPHVMHIITRLVRGGAQRVVLALLRGLRGRGWDLTLVAGPQTGAEGSLWNEADGLGITTVQVPSLVRELAPLRDYRALRELRRIIKAYRPDVVHAHTSKAGFLGCLAARREGVPAVVLAPHGHILRHNAQIPGVPARGLKRRLLAAACKRNVRYAHVVVTPNDAERSDGIRHGLWSAEEVLTVPNGVDTDRFRPGGRTEARRALGLSPERPVVGVVARLTREKGVDLAVETVRMLRGVTLVIVGDGPERESLETQVDSLYVADRTIFTGNWENIEEILPAFDVCLAPSRTEGHGMVAAEALACGVPVVASRVGGLQSLIVHEQTGLLVEPEDVPAYAQSIARLISDRPLAAALGRAGRARMESCFSYEAMVTETLELYGRLLSRGARAGIGRTSSVNASAEISLSQR